MESTIYINTTLREARAGTTGAGLPEITLTLLAQWLCHIRFFAPGEEPALLSSPAFVLSIKETPTGTALVRTESVAENDDGDGYDFEFESIDGESLRALLGDEPILDLVLELEWTVDSVTERVHMPCTVINAYNRPDDVAPDPAEAETDAWLAARAVRFDSAQTLTTEQKTQARSNIGAAASTHTHNIADVSGLQNALDGKSANGHTHNISDVSGLQTALDNKAASGHTHSNASTSVAGFMSPQDKTKLDGLGEGVTETVPAVAQVSTITINTSSASDLDGDYIDVPITGATVRAWFDIDNSGSAPASPSPGRLIEVDISSAGNSGDFSSALAAALAADPDLNASSSGNTTTVDQPAGALSAPSTTDNSNIAIVVTTPGTDAYPRFLPIEGSQVTAVNAALLEGTPAAGFASFSHTHDYLTDLTNRPQCKRLASDFVSTSTSLASVSSLAVSVQNGKTYHFDFHGFYSTSSSIEDAGFAMLGPTATNIVVQSEIITASTGTTSFARATAWDTIHQTNAATARTNVPFRISGMFTASADGTLVPRLKTELSSAGQSTTILSGAALHVIPVD